MATTQAGTQYEHGAIAFGVALVGAILAAVLPLPTADVAFATWANAMLGGFVASLGAAGFYYWRENLSQDHGWGYWKRQRVITSEQHAAGMPGITFAQREVHKWDARRDWMIPALVPLTFGAIALALFTDLWFVLLVPMAAAGLVAGDKHPHPGLVVEGLR